MRCSPLAGWRDGLICTRTRDLLLALEFVAAAERVGRGSVLHAAKLGVVVVVRAWVRLLGADSCANRRLIIELQSHVELGALDDFGRRIVRASAWRLLGWIRRRSL